MANEPRPNESTIESKAREDRRPLVDRLGRRFSPRLHRSDADGRPILTKDGGLQIKPGKVGKDSAPTRPHSSTSGGTDPKRALGYDTSGRAMAATIFILFQCFGGKEFKPVQNQEVDEVEEMTAACSAFCEQHDMHDIPAGWALAITVAMYAAPRFSMPATKRKAGIVKEWFVAGFRFIFRRNES